jgi:hypothetical protein
MIRHGQDGPSGLPRRAESHQHRQIKAAIVGACTESGCHTVEEYRGSGWVADVLASVGSKRVAFEVQLSPQSLKRTLGRQEKYVRAGVRGCWLFQRPLSKLLDERPDLPLFYVSAKPDGGFSVSLSGRRDLPLPTFVQEFIGGRIRFCETARTKAEQNVILVLVQMECWKCKATNHVYYVDTGFRSACNAVIEPEEVMWSSERREYRPEIVDAVRRFLQSGPGGHLHLGEIKQRHSKTIGGSYVSFGCYRCDSIFGDWFVQEAKMEAMCGGGGVATAEASIRLQGEISVPMPHWCFPGGEAFCDEGRENELGG